jgi:hypothetical protein
VYLEADYSAEDLNGDTESGAAALASGGFVILGSFVALLL